MRRGSPPAPRISRLTLAGPVVALLVLAGPLAAQSTAPVRVGAGWIEGTVAASGVREFKGIPFAAPPVGTLRWKPPQPPIAWKGVRQTTAFGPRCMQLPIFSDMVFRSDGMSEDCLYLNVWAPAVSAGTRLPVLVYFYGGGFVGGDGSELRYDGESMAGRGIVVVTVNYRLGVFGFLAHPALTKESPHHASGNYGLLDQVAALQWVHDNIAAFGGDPERITIAGESAGSIAVSALMTSPLSRRLIAGAIGESGALIRPTFPPVPLAEGERDGVAFARLIHELTLPQLRALTAEALLQASGQPDVGRFPITIDGYFLTRSPEAVLAAGDQAHVPLLVGWNSEEQSWQSLLGLRQPTPANYRAEVRSIFGRRTAEALRVLPGSTEKQVKASATVLAGARFTAFSTWKWAALQTRTGGRPVYRYLFVHPRPPPKQPGENPPPDGAVHSAEIEYALGNLGTNDVYAWTPEDSVLSATMENYFANFVRTGNPNGQQLPTWPATDAGETTQVMILDVHSHAAPAPYESAYRFLDTFYHSH